MVLHELLLIGILILQGHIPHRLPFLAGTSLPEQLGEEVVCSLFNEISFKRLHDLATADIIATMELSDFFDYKLRDVDSRLAGNDGQHLGGGQGAQGLIVRVVGG